MDLCAVHDHHPLIVTREDATKQVEKKGYEISAKITAEFGIGWLCAEWKAELGGKWFQDWSKEVSQSIRQEKSFSVEVPICFTKEHREAYVVALMEGGVRGSRLVCFEKAAGSKLALVPCGQHKAKNNVDLDVHSRFTDISKVLVEGHLMCDCPGHRQDVVQPTSKPPTQPNLSVIDAGAAEALLKYADDFGIGRTTVFTKPGATTVVVRAVGQDDEFGTASTSVTAVGPHKATTVDLKTAIKKTADGDGKPQVKLDLAELGKLGVTGILTGLGSGPDAKTSGPVNYIQFVPDSATSGAPVGASGIGAIRDPFSDAAPNLMPRFDGKTRRVAIEQDSEGGTIAIGQRLEGKVVPIATFKPERRIEQFDADNKRLAVTEEGSFEGDRQELLDLDPATWVVGRLADDGVSFKEGTAQPLNDVVKGGLPSSNYGRLTPKIEATPKTVEVRGKFTVRAWNDPAALANSSSAREIPVDVAEVDLEIAIFFEGKEVASGIGEAKYEGVAMKADDLMQFTATNRRRKDRTVALTALRKRKQQISAAVSSAPEAFRSALQKLLDTSYETIEKRLGGP